MNSEHLFESKFYSQHKQIKIYHIRTKPITKEEACLETYVRNQPYTMVSNFYKVSSSIKQSAVHNTITNLSPALF